MKRRSRNRRRNKANKLDFQRLEARQLLAGDLIGSHQAAGVLPTGANVVVNGDFESFIDGADRFFDESEVPGWNAFDSATGQEINIMTWNVAGYDNVLDIDSTTTDFDRVYQEVATEANAEYLITFDYRNHPTFDPNATQFTHDFEIWWNNILVGRLTGGDNWNTGAIRVTSSNLATTRLLFCEIQESGAATGDGRGALLDNVRVVKFDEVAFSNGGFESTAADVSVFFRPEDVVGWTAITDGPSQPLLQIDEVGASEGDKFLNLDTTAENRDMVFADVATVAGAAYYLTFDMRNDGEQTINPDELRVRWNQDWAGTIFGTNQWETYGLFLTADSDVTNLMFLEPGESTGSGSGPLIDNVQMFMVGDAPLTVDANGDEAGVDGVAVFVPGIGAQAISEDLTITNPSGNDLSSVVVTLNGVVDGTDEMISINEASIPVDGTGSAKIVVTAYDPSTNELVLTGNATAQEYQAVLRTLAYSNSADNVSTTSRLVNIDTTYQGLPTERVAETAINLTIETSQAAIDSAIITKFIVDNDLDAQDLGSGLFAVIDNPGSGLSPTFNSTVRVKYNGKFIKLNDQNQLVEGESFDFSSDEGFTTALTNVIQGWGLGIPAFKTGGIGQLIIPSNLAYGVTGFGSIPPNSVLLFDIELLQVLN